MAMTNFSFIFNLQFTPNVLSVNFSAIFEVNEIGMAQKAHVLIVPFPSQGHVRPLLKLAFQIADHGIKITFVNSESVQAKLVASLGNKEKFDKENCGISFATIPDIRTDEGAPWELKSNMMKVMPGFLEDLIKKERFSCVIADGSLGWILEVAERNGVNHAGVFPLAVGSVALTTHIPELIKTARIDINGTMAENDEFINLSPEVPSWKKNELTWNYPGGTSSIGIQKLMFDLCLSIQQTVEQEKWIICNTCCEIEPAACNLIPNMLPIGPLIGFNCSQDSAGSFWPEDMSCFSWLDKKPAGSVIYIAFGSIAVVSQEQFDELALGLELSGRPFLWVVRSDLANGETANYPDGFLERVADHGKIVEWAPQEKVLAHPSVACFISHCGWNSTMEGLGMGVPFLCWPSFGDQYHNQSYISDIWKIGLKLNPDQNGIRNSHEIETKIEMLLSEDSFKANSKRLKGTVQESVRKGGSSFRNFETFINYLKQ